MAFESARALVPLAARTTNGNSGSQSVGTGRDVNILVHVSATAGTTPSLALEVEWLDVANNAWAKASPADTFTAITAAGTTVKTFVAKSPQFRVVWTLTGTTPSFTFGLQAYTT